MVRCLLLRVAAATWSACAEWRGIARRIDTSPTLNPTLADKTSSSGSVQKPRRLPSRMVRHEAVNGVCSRDESRLPPAGHSYIMW